VLKKERFFILAALFILLPILNGGSVVQAAGISGTGGQKIAAHSNSEETIQDLLLFWEEKDLYVRTATRYEKPLSQAAENITVITAKDIEEMNAHTVSEVLNRVTGLFVSFGGQDFGSSALYYIQGSEERHVTVMIDGVAWNFLSGGNAETNNIPVRIIDRIEIIKGPGSSAWGSALGGVINIITKEPTDSCRPSGSITGSYGEANSQDYSADISSRLGSVGYYLYAGHQESEGLRDDRYFHNNSFYSKIRLPLAEDIRLGLTFGYSEPEQRFLTSPAQDITSDGDASTLFATLSLDAVITPELTFNLDFHTLRQKFTQTSDVFGSGFYGPAGDLFLENMYKEKTTGGAAKLIWKHDLQTTVLGAEIIHGSLDQTVNLGPFLQSWGLPASLAATPDVGRWGVFFNDTVTLEKFSITPGIRYDHNSVSGNFTSPSLGMTYKTGEHTILRVSAARGFTMPPLSFSSAGGLFLDPNPSLKPERVWSYQAGVESGLTDYLWVKATIFYHDVKDAIVKELYAGGAPAFNDLYLNKGNIRRRGFELEAETTPFYNFSLKAGFAYVKKEFLEDGEDADRYACNVSLKYDDRRSFMAQLFGHYIWWDIKDPADEAKYNAFIWDLNLRKKLFPTGKTNTELFFTLHNIFNGSQYTFDGYINPDRWAEGGLRVKF